MIDICLGCSKRILSHAKKISCKCCNDKCHLKCISVNDFEMSSLKSCDDWYCFNCMSDIMPFINIVEDSEFYDALSLKDHFEINWDNLYDRLFNPFTLSDDMPDDPMGDIDPDQNFYSDMAIHSHSLCKYYSERTFNDLVETQLLELDNIFSLLHVNTRSIPCNFSSLTAYLECLDFIFNFIGVSETWLSDSNYDLFGLDGYHFEENHRSSRSGGGVGLFIKNSIEFLRRKDLEVNNDVLESIFIEVPVCEALSSRKVLIGVVYRPPGTNLKDFNEALESILSTIDRRYCYLLGDWNMNLLAYESHNDTTLCIDTFYSHGYSPLINRPTRVTSSSATIIDNIFTNNHDATVDAFQGILVTDISDHFPIFHIGTSNKKEVEDRFIVKRIFDEKNKSTFLKNIGEVNWENLISSDHAQLAFTEFHRKFFGIYDKSFPKRKVKIYHNKRKRKISDELKEAIEIKNKLFFKSLKFKSSYNQQMYTIHRNKVSKLKQDEERKHIALLLEANKTNLRKTWAVLKSIINKKRNKRVQTRFRLANHDIITDKKLISEGFNDFFANIGPKLASNIPPQATSVEQFMGDRILQSILISEVTMEEFSEIICSLRKCAPGYDEIDKDILFMSLPTIGNVLLSLLNFSLSQGLFPNELKVANIIPLFKSEDPMMFNNYRPVSLLSIFSKIFEKAMYTRLVGFLEMHKILYDKQFGFRKKHSAFMAHMILVDNLINALQNKEYVIGVFLDFSKAFDTVDHSILLKKLYHYGIRGIAYEWFESYLSGRTQFVTYNDEKSSIKPMTCGVPQGSILGPILFLLYINDLVSVCKHSLPFLFADDTNLFTSGKNLNDLKDKVNEELANISVWLKVNKLSLNVKKTHFLIFSNKNSKPDKVEIFIDDKAINQEKSTKFLGVYIDDKLNWKTHIEHISKKVSRGIGILCKARRLLNLCAMKTLYYSFIYPYLMYCNHVWAVTCPTRLKGIRVLQNKVISIMTSSKKFTRLEPVFEKLGILRFDDINKYLYAKFMFKWKHNEVPSIFVNCFPHLNEIHDHDTRQSARNEVYFNGFKSNLSQQRFMYKAPFYWNAILKLNIDVNVSEPVFNYSIKHHLKSKLL